MVSPLKSKRSCLFIVLSVTMLLFLAAGCRHGITAAASHRGKTESDMASPSGDSSAVSPAGVPSSAAAPSSAGSPAISQGPSVSSGPAAPVTAKPDSLSGSVFIGDSLTVDMLNYGLFSRADIVGAIGASAYTALTNHQMAINGNKSDLAWIPDRVAAKRPEKIFMMFGANDLTWGSQMTESKFTGYYGQLIDDLRARCPGAKIYVQSILPITAAAENSKNEPYDNRKIEAFNQALQSKCMQKGVAYLDVGSALKGPDGRLPASASDDGLHLHSGEYTLWYNYLVSHT